MTSNEVEQTEEDQDAEETTQSKHRTMTRRGFLGTAATGAAVAAGGTATAQTNTTTTDDGSEDDSGGIHDAPNSINGGEVDVEFSGQTAAKLREAGIMLMTTPVGPVLWSAGTTGYAVTNMAHWAWGQISSGEDKANDQLALDVNAHARTIRDNLEALVKSNYNNFEMLNNEALIAGEVAAVKSIKNNQSEANVAAKSQNEIYEMIAVYEENFYRVLESAIVRLANLHRQQVIAFGDDPDYSPTVKYKTHQNDNYHHKIIGTRTVEVELVNGETIETECLACNDGSLNSNGDETGVVYIHPLFQGDLTDKVVNYSELNDSENNRRTLNRLATSWHASDDVDPISFYVKRYDSNNGRVYPFHSDYEEGLVNQVTSNSAYGSGWGAYINEHVIQRAETLTSDMQQYVSDLFDALSSGEIENVEEVMSPQAYAELMAGDWLETGSTGFPIGAARMGGYSTDIKRTGSYTHVDADGDNQTYDEANLLWDSRNPPTLGSYTSEELGGGDWTINVPIGSGSTLHVDGYDGMEFTASHASESVDSIGVKFGSGDSATPVKVQSSTSSITPTQDDLESSLSEHGVSHGNTVDITIEVTTGAGSSTTVTATGIEVLVETRLRAGEGYEVPNGDSTVYIADSNGMHSIPSGDTVRIESVQDADGNAMEYITVGDETLMTLDDTDDVQKRWDAILDSQQNIEEETPDGDGSLGGGGAGGGVPSFGGDIGWTHVLGGIGIITILSGLAALVSEDGRQ